MPDGSPDGRHGDEGESSSSRPRPPGDAYARPRFEGWIERQVREAIERGEFDDLPGMGKPLTHLDDRDENWWIRRKLEREGISPPLPSGLQLRKEREEMQSTLADIASEQQAREVVEDFNARVRDSILRGTEGPRVFVRTLNVDETIAEWRRRRG
ncbi:DUF1992 domain-containing protein [Mariniluteicoccus endophyticus]